MDTRDDLIPDVAIALADLGYAVADEAWNAAAHESVRPLGRGGSSIVLPALYRDRLRRAVKVFIPRPDLAATIDVSRFLASYDNEVERAAALSHENLSKITDYLSITVGSETYPCIVTEYVPGTDLRTYARDAADGHQILDALQGVLRGLEYLHSNGVMHCDVKQDNIRARAANADAGETQARAVLVDLGSSRDLYPATSERDRELLHLFTTPRYVLSRLKYVISNRTDNRITRKNLRDSFPYLDLHAFGIVLDDLLQDAQVRQKLARAVGSNESAGFAYVLRRLKNPEPGRHHFQSAAEVAEALRRLPHDSLAAFGIGELAPAPRKGVVLPATGSRIHGSGRVDRVMSHPLFQRFHNLHQLDMLHWTLPGATHTRYVHAASCYELARQAVTFMLNNWRLRQELTRHDIVSTIFPAMLNQVGHYHFLHMFEDFLEERATVKEVSDSGLLRDDELLDGMLGISDNVGRVFADVRDERGRTLGDVVESLGLDWTEVRRRQRSPASPLEGVLAALLSGPVDVEKLSYLRNDSRAAGLQFGQALDGSAIFEAIVLPKEEDWQREQGANRVALGVREQAMSYLENGVLTRYWNIQAAYWHRTNRAIQAMIKYQIAALLNAGLLDFEQYLRATLNSTDDGALRWLNSEFVEGQRAGAIDATSVNPLADLLESRRVIYLRLLTISGKSQIQGRDPDHNIYRRVQAMSPLKDQRVYAVVAEALSKVKPDLKVAPGEILVDLPRAPRDERRGTVLVYTDDTHEYMGELFKISANLAQHQQSFEQNVKRMRIFLHPRVYNSLHAGGRVQAAYDATLDALRGEFAT